MSEITTRVLNEVFAERKRQEVKCGGKGTDDEHNPLDWHEMIADYNAWARRMACMGSLGKTRRRYIQIAALAVAAVEALDRRNNHERSTVDSKNTRRGSETRMSGQSCDDGRYGANLL